MHIEDGPSPPTSCPLRLGTHLQVCPSQVDHILPLHSLTHSPRTCNTFQPFKTAVAQELCSAVMTHCQEPCPTNSKGKKFTCNSLTLRYNLALAGSVFLSVQFHRGLVSPVLFYSLTHTLATISLSQSTSLPGINE